ncbi:MAG TPA: hypothetical protein VGJ20_42465 [Xanthobacteraceae bacterium]
MTSELSAEGVEIYVVKLRRWPDGQRQAAIVFAEDHPEEAATILESTRRLDEALDRYVVPWPGAKLIRMITDSAPSIFMGSSERS